MIPAMLTRAQVLVLLALAVVLGVPVGFALTRDGGAGVPAGAERLVIITPHNEQIRFEFGRAFARWHQETHGTPVVIDWRQPGGTSAIRRQLLSIYEAAIRRGNIAPDGAAEPGAMPYDIFFGGGSYEHGLIKRGVTVQLDDAEVTVPLSVPIAFDQPRLDAIYGANRIGASELYDPERFWLGTAVSGFGIIYNRDALALLGVDEPVTWRDMGDPRLAGWVALADPRKSGSVTTTYDSILNNHGWDDGWRILRDMTANSRTFSASSTRIPIDVSQGEAAMGLAIDFYGRYQSQAVVAPGETLATSRVGYVDPPGLVFIDADPISILRGAPNPELALRFVEFTLTDLGQSLWQLPAGESPDGFGPLRYELRRMPVRRDVYARLGERFVDDVDPFAIASTTESRGWRSAIAPLMAAFAIDTHDEQTEAWRALHEIRAAAAAAPEDAALADLAARAEAAFYAMPEHEFLPGHERAGERLRFTAETYRTIRTDWANRTPKPRTRIAYTAFFRDQYQSIIRMARHELPGD